MMGRRRSALPLWLLSLFFLLVGCAEADLERPAQLPSLSFEELKQRVARIRELSFQHEISLENKGTEEIRGLLEKSILEEYGQEKLEQLGQIYSRLGLLPERTDFLKSLTDLRLYQQGFHYDSRKKVVVLPHSPLKSGLAFLRSPWSGDDDTAKQLILTHAFSSILQGQHFNWQERLRNKNTEDLALTLRALTKGDTVLVGMAFLLGNGKQNGRKILDGLKGLPNLAAQMEKEMSHLPELLRQEARFQFIYGSQFVAWAYSHKGWKGVDALFIRPPLSTEQILHPEKYYVKRDDPIRITPWGLIRQFRGKKIMDDTLGEFLIQSLLSQSLSREEAMQAAAGWAGDNLIVFQEGEDLILGWVTAWDDPHEAAEFYRSYRSLLENRNGVALEPTQRSADTLIAPPQSSRPLLLQMRGNLVFFLDGVPSPRSVEIAESIWDELETGADPQPLELARGRRHSPWVTR